MTRKLNLLLAMLALISLAACGGATPDDGNGPLGKGDRTDEPSSLLRYPVILVHGFNASPDSGWGYSQAVIDALQKRLGKDYLFVAQTNPYQSSAVRGAELGKFVATVLNRGFDKVHLLAHSQGGLDSRWLASPAGGAMGDRIASVTTLSTPHHGTLISDVLLFALDSSGETPEPECLAKAALALGSAKSWVVTQVTEIMTLALNETAATYEHQQLEAHRTMDVATFEAEFNQRYVDDARVRYLSWAGVSNVAGLYNPQDHAACNEGLKNSDWAISLGFWDLRDAMSVTLKPVAAIVANGFSLTPNDGVITVESAKHGLFRGCIKADHLAEVGQGANGGVTKSFWSGRVEFDPVAFLSQTVVNDLIEIEAGREIR